MADTLQIKRRAAGGAAGAPASLAIGELAYNEQDAGLYIGKTDGSVVKVNPATGISDAPSDGASYGRLNGAWSSVAAIAGATFTGQIRAPTMTVTTGIFTAQQNGNRIGQVSANLATGALVSTDPGILFYKDTSAAWAGIGVDGNGCLWFRSAVSGSPAASFYSDAQQIVNFLKSPLAPTPTAGDSSNKVATTAFVAANPGVTGPTGAQGSAGAPGSAGATGPTGPAAAGGGASVIISDTAPGSPSPGTLWWESDSGTMAISYPDADSTQWVQVSGIGPQGSQGPQGPQGPTGAAGSQGVTGATGPVGVTGSQGSSGVRNRIINGAMMVSQENGAAASTATGYFPVDMFQIEWAATTAVVSASQVTSKTPSGSPNRIRCTVTTADTSMTTSKHYQIYTSIEGLRVQDLSFGLAQASTVVLQFGVKAPAGTYCVTLSNNAMTRTYIAEYVVAAGEANTDVIKSVVIPGDTTSTWLTDNTIGMSIHFTLATGPTYISAAGWQAGNMLGTSNQFNWLGTVNNVFELFDVSLTEGTVAPVFKMPEYPDELRACQRYYEIMNVIVGSGAPGAYFATGYWKITKRVSPTLSYFFDGGSGASIVPMSTYPGVGVYQNVAHSAGAHATVKGNARL